MQRSTADALTTRDRWGAGALVITAGIVGAVLASSWFIDLRVYVIGARHAFEPDLYDQRLADAGLPFTYPPFAAMVMAPFGHLPFAFGAVFLTAVSFAGILLVTRRTLTLAPLPVAPGVLLPLAVAALAFEPIWATLSFGQVNLVALTLCFLDLTRRSRFRGVMTGLAAGLKLTPLFFIAYLVVTRQFRAAAVGTATFAATVVIGFALNPHGAWTFRTSAVRDPSRVGSAIYAGNQSLTGALPRWHGATIPSGAATLAQVATAVVTLAAAAWLWRRGSELESVLTAAFGMLIVSPISWSHHWVWAWPAMLVLVSTTVRRWSDRGAHTSQGSGRCATWATAVFAVAWLVCFTSRSLWWGPREDDRELTWNLVDKIAGNAYVPAAVLWVAWAILTAPRRPSRRVESAT